MQFSKPTSRSDNEIALLPLTNIVFLLMIFFLLIGRITQPSAFEVQPPTSNSQTPVSGRALRVEIAANGRIAVNGQRVAKSQLAATVRSQRSASSGGDVLLRADSKDSTKQVIQVMQVLHRAGVEKLRLVTRGKS